MKIPSHNVLVIITTAAAAALNHGALGDEVVERETRRVLQSRRRRPSVVRPTHNNRVLNMEPGDLNVRFSKVPNRNGTDVSGRLPLTNNDFPMRGELANILKRDSDAESIMTEDDYELRNINERRYFQLAGGPPTYPNQDPNHPFWQKDFRAVVEALVHLRADGDPADLITLPNRWKNFSMQEVANAVHDEYPGLWQSELLKELFDQDVKIDYDILPFRCVDDFIGLPFRMAELNTWATMSVGPTNFRAKWTYGRARPEEVGWRIAHNGTLAPYCPKDLLNIINGWNLTNPFDFTGYKRTGSPKHPSWPAMHSAASSASLWMPVVFDLTDEQYCQVLLTDWAVSYARTIAGVHYPTDNVAGLMMGQYVIADKLADYLVTRWNAPRNRVLKKIKSKLVNWAQFDHRTCTFVNSSTTTTN